jgi:hypothetical protein
MVNKAAIRSLVGLLNGCKATELAAREEMAHWHDESDRSLPDVLEEMVRAGELVEVEYVLPNHPERTKSFLLPKGTEVRLRGV